MAKDNSSDKENLKSSSREEKKDKTKNSLEKGREDQKKKIITLRDIS